MAELTEVQVKEIVRAHVAEMVEVQLREFMAGARMREIVTEVLAAAKPRRKGPPSLFSHRSKKSNAPKKGGFR